MKIAYFCTLLRHFLDIFGEFDEWKETATRSWVADVWWKMSSKRPYCVENDKDGSKKAEEFFKKNEKKVSFIIKFLTKKKKKTEIIFMENREWNFRGGLFFHFFCKLHALHHAWAINCFSLFWEKLRFNTTLFCFLRFYFSCVRYQGYFMNHDHFFYNKRIFSRITILKFCLNVLMVQLATQAESQKLV